MKQDPATPPDDGTQERLLERLLRHDLLDDYDEELELEWEDRLERRVPGAPPRDADGDLPRRTYFNELFRLQRELVMLQDWVVETGH